MQTIKTAVVVVLLLGVCYGAYVALNAPEPVLPPELEAWSSENGGLNLDVDDGSALAIDIPQLGDTPRSDLDALAPPNLAPLPPAGTTAGLQPGKTGPLGTEPAPPPLDFGKLDPTKLTDSQTNSSTAGLGLPPELEGSSVPLPSADTSGPASGSGSNGSLGMSATGAPLPSDSKAVAVSEFPVLHTIDPPLGRATGGALSMISTSNSALQGSPTGADKTDPSGRQGPGDKPAPSDPAGAPASSGTARPNQPFKTAREEALKLANEGKLREALAKLSPYYNHIDLTREEQVDLIDLLDALAAEVIYSKRHLLESPFIVSAGETLESIANRYKISPEVLAKINLMPDSKVVLAGSQLKVLTGPMRADVNLTRGELTLFLHDLYAGRFPISVGKDPAPVEGTYEIIDRRRDRTYYGAGSQVLPASDGRNPYGGYWMSLGKDLSIHGSPETTTPELANAGCISLAPLDAREVYSLLSLGSQVTIHR